MAGLGPDDIRGDFLCELLGHERNLQSINKSFCNFEYLFAGDEVPPYLQFFMGEEPLIGIDKKDNIDQSINFESDTKSIILGWI